MKTKFILILLVIVMVSGCIVRPAHRAHRVKVVAPVKTLVVLEQEHSSKGIVVIQSKPKKGRKCWSHKKHLINGVRSLIAGLVEA
jgi:hypothetical protein